MILLTLSLGWKIFFLITIICFIGSVLLFIKGCSEVGDPPNGTVIKYLEDEEMFMENDLVDEFSPAHIELESTLHRVRLRNKLHKIEEERKQDNVDF